MSSFATGDRVHVAGLGSGTVREGRNGGRYLVEIKGQMLIVNGKQLQPAAAARISPTRQPAMAHQDGTAPPSGRVLSLDLHGKTSADALDALDGFLNDAILAGAAEARIIHGRSGGVVKAAVHKRLAQLPPVRSFRLDPRNAGVTIVTL
ncbi:MAG: Smr/MutS family protein [Vicinamibacterales bacterium]